MKNKKLLLFLASALFATAGSAQQLKSNYIDWGPGSSDFANTLGNWEKGSQLTEDDNFFISRVKPKLHFRNANTQVRPSLTVQNDKRLLAWVPVGDVSKKGLPDGVYDSEVFTMWPYVTHWGHWTAPLGRVPGAFLDVAHKNGVAVSSVASIPYGSLNTTGTAAWRQMIIGLNGKGEKAADFFKFYGVDGMGYNSEFSYSLVSNLRNLRDFHADLVKRMRKTNPLFENIWYDGTNDQGKITFDKGLYTHNRETFGDSANVRSSLFLNYNWNRASLLSASQIYAEDTLKRNPLDLYCGVNMQGGEPRSNNWPLLKDYRLSIGLWGAHSSNMFWESRGEQGSSPDVKQRVYQLRTERWFTGGTRNPANTPEVISSMNYSAGNTSFHGMSSFMTARSALKWNLSEEPFISYFNIGNGKFLNWKGVRQNDKEWYNIGMQDYLPTWRWWFATDLLSTNVPTTGLDAEFVWDDAYVGGSTMRVFGTTANEYLHLFKTEFALQQGDIITVRYKVIGGKANMNLVLTAVGNEKTAVGESDFSLLKANDDTDEDLWVERTFTVGSNLAGKDLALVALHFENAEALNLYLGEFSIVRGAAAKPAVPVIAKTQVLAYSKEGYDGKIIFNMPNDKAPGEPCYNLDVKTAFFKLYAQQEGCEPIFMGFTTSWAGMFYNVPLNLSASGRKVRFGVSAVSLDHGVDSDIAWGDYLTPPTYVYNDEVKIDKSTIKPGEVFTMSYVDPEHESGTWKLVDLNGNTVLEQQGRSITVSEGLPNVGSYTLYLTGNVYAPDGTTRTQSERIFNPFVQITSEGVGALPEIYTLTANGEESDIEIKTLDNVQMAYTGRKADGSGSQGIELKENALGATCSDLDIVGNKSFTLAYWLKINKITQNTQFFSIVNHRDSWPNNNWGWNWSTLGTDGSIIMNYRNEVKAENPNTTQYTYGKSTMPIGVWAHIAIIVDFNAQGHIHHELYINGIKQNPSKVVNNQMEQSSDEGYFNFSYPIKDGDVIAIGGPASGRAGIDGVVDNMQFYHKALTAAEVKTAMGDLDPNNLPADLSQFWSFEQSAPDGKYFSSVGSGNSVKAGVHDYTATGQEGQGMLNWLDAEYTAGCPFVSGQAFPVVTKPVWTARKATITAQSGTDQQGSATLNYRKSGDYEVTLKLENAHGAAERTFRVIHVDFPEGIETTEAASEVKTYVTGGDVIVKFAKSGYYDVKVFNAAGQLVRAKAHDAKAGDNVQLSIRKTGVYMVNIVGNNGMQRTVKLIVK